tara:strand:- start:412 stop:633 length:222 start_codon:yes stop_codon:yes gene_type:complete
MKKFFSFGISLMLFSFITSSLYAATPLVDAVWVKDQIGKEGVVMLDLRTPASYKKGHVCPVRFIPITAKMDGG